MSWSERLQGIGGILLAIVFFVGGGFIVAGFILGATWAAEHLLGPLVVAGWITLAVDILLLLPLSIARPLRPVTGVVIH